MFINLDVLIETFLMQTSDSLGQAKVTLSELRGQDYRSR